MSSHCHCCPVRRDRLPGPVWARARSVTLRFRSRETCTFLREQVRDVESQSSVVTERTSNALQAAHQDDGIDALAPFDFSRVASLGFVNPFLSQQGVRCLQTIVSLRPRFGCDSRSNSRSTHFFCRVRVISV